MSGSILERVRKDARRYVTSSGWEETITLTTNTNSLTVTVTGYATKHWISIDTDGLPVNAKNAHVTVDEKMLTALSYPVRNVKGEVSMLGHKIQVADSTGNIKKYVVRENYPDETLGLIVLILSDFNG